MNTLVESDTLEVNGTRLYCEQAGSGDTVVFVHGGGGDRRHWDGQFLALAERFHVVRYDLRGYGRSDPPKKAKPYRHQDDLKALLGALGIENAHIAGFSLGCQVIVDAYTVYPELFRSIVAVGPFVSGHSSPATAHLFDGYIHCGEVFVAEGQAAAAQCFVNIPAFNPERISAQAKASTAEICDDFDWRFLDPEDALQQVDPVATEVLANIEVPLQIITAEFDAAACLEVADLLQKKVPHSKRADMVGATHFMLMEEPAKFNAILGGFLAQA